MTSPPTSEAPTLTCPLCEDDELRLLSHTAARCASCGCLLNGTAFLTLRQIVSLPDALGDHACECGHPEMRRLPDGVFWCPDCAAKVLPVVTGKDSSGHAPRSKAYLSGWLDGRYGGASCFTVNAHLKQWEDPHDRLDYYRGHRDGGRAPRTKGDATPKVA